MRHQTRPPPPPSHARRGLLVGGLVLAAAGVAVVAWVLAVAAGLVGGADPAMDDTPRTLNLEGAPSTTGGLRESNSWREHVTDTPFGSDGPVPAFLLRPARLS